MDLKDVRYAVGVDGGGTKTSLMLFSTDPDGRFDCLSRAACAGMNYNHTGVEQAVTAVTDGLRRLCADAGITPDALSAVGIGDPSCDVETAGPAGDAFRARLCDGLRVPVLLKSDAYVTLYALTRGRGPGVLTISGTGAICIGEDADRHLFVAGGWGQLTGDEGSGHYIGLCGLKAALRAADGVAPGTSLLPAVLDRFGVRDARGLIGVLYDPARPAEPAALAPLVDACAQAGDAVAQGILEKAADWLAGYTLSVIRRTGAKLVGVHGSVLKHNRIVRAAFEERVRAAFPDVTICEPSLSPEEAAARLAVDSLTGLRKEGN